MLAGPGAVARRLRADRCSGAPSCGSEAQRSPGDPPRVVHPSVEELAIPDADKPDTKETANAGTREAMCLMVEIGGEGATTCRSSSLPA